MKLLNRLLQGIDPIQIHGQDNVAIQSMTADSRQIRRDSLFIARQGVQIDGHAFIEGAIQDGACAILCESMPSSIPDGVTVIQVVNSHRAYAMLAANWHGNPSKDLQVVGVTGTNGKTTVATLLHKLYMDSGIKSGLLSTISVHIHNEQLPATHTTPDAWDIQSHLAAMVTAGCKVAFMEVSSHGLAQERSHGIHFAGALFTNISRDHLDYHADMDEYVAIKKRLFDQLPSDAFALVNLDDKHGETMLLDCKARHFTYALERPASYKTKILESLVSGTLISINTRECWLQIIGRFNAYNATAIFGCCNLLGMVDSDALQALSALQGVRGRFQRVMGPKSIMGIVDYAHTPDALDNVLSTLKELRQGNQRIITVIGCGGDRDKGKRPQMALIAASESDYSILTSDNPRTEDPQAILRDMEQGLDAVIKRKAITMADRAEAIKLACQQARAGDLILVAGKGHETTQDIQGVKHNFDDVQHLKDNLQSIHG